MKRQRWRNPGDDLGVVAVGLEGGGELGEAAGDVAGDFGGFLGGIERIGIGPNGAEGGAVLFLAEIGEEDAVVFRVREALVVAAGAGELGVEVDAVADVAHDEKRRAALGDGERGDVAAALVEGTFEGAVEGGGAAFAVAGFGGKRGRRQDVTATFGGALLGFADEVAGLVEVDVVGDGGAVGIHAGDGAVEDVEVFRGIGRGGIGAGDIEDVAEFGEEHLVVRTLSGTGVFPAGDEGVDLLGCGGRHAVGKWRIRRDAGGTPTIFRQGGKGGKIQRPGLI